jgi:CheY-like chemotaxis protein
LPLPAAELVPAPRPALRPPSRTGGGSVLVVEDDDTVAEVVIGLLAALGYEAQHAPHALAALAALAAQQFELAFLDLDLPGMDGLELARLMRAQAPATVLIALTARADAQAEPEALAAGMHGFLRKPVTSLLLQEAIERAGAGLGQLPEVSAEALAC